MSPQDLSASERRYHDTSAAYVLPNDAPEHERLNRQADAIKEMLGGESFLAPLDTSKPPSTIVDIGCGTGIATIQLATRFPSAQVYGIDLSAVSEQSKKLAPANVTFIQEDVLSVDPTSTNSKTDSTGNSCSNTAASTALAPASADYIFGRMLILGITDWGRYFRTVAAALKPGGLVEHQDINWKYYRVQSSDELSADWSWYPELTGPLESSGLDMAAGLNAAEHMRAAGLEVVSQKNFEWSFSPSPKTPDSMAMGRYAQADLMPAYALLLRKLLPPRGVPKDKVDRIIEECLRDLQSEEGLHQKYTVTVARKPEH